MNIKWIGAIVVCLLAVSVNAAQVSIKAVNDWGSAFQGEATITNDGNTAIQGWTLSFTSSFTISQVWNAKIVSSAGTRYTLANMGYNATINPGQSISFGFIASPGGSAMPSGSGITFNGGTVTPPPPTPTPTPQPSTTPTSRPSSTPTATPTTMPTAIPSRTPSPTPTSTATPDPSNALPDDDWLSVSGNMIINKEGNAVWLTGANWFGFNTTERVFHGLWSVNMNATVKAMADRGINLVRVPFSTQIVHEWMQGRAVTPQINTHANPELTGKNSLEIFDAFLASAKRHGIKVMLDAHSAEADNSGHIYPLWTKGTITEQIFIDTWVWLAERYKNDDTVVAFDLENEPHGQPHAGGVFAKWDDSNDANNWKHVAEKTAAAVLAVHPEVLIMIEGIEAYPKDGVTWTSRNSLDYYFNWWGGNLRGVADHPVLVPGHQDKIMYSPHDYGPRVFAQRWFYPGFSKQTLIADVWQDNWLYIHTSGTSPLMIGEWGGFLDGGDNETWLFALQSLINDYKLHHTFWVLNPNSGDTGGLLTGNWVSWDEAKYDLIEPVLWQNTANQFIGLDHEIPLGANGISVKQHYENGGAEPIGL